mgnify:FL=1
MSILDKRGSGVLMHISSLPGKTGIGTLGKQAYNFVDLLYDANQTYWQILPVGPTGYGDSPYQSYSTYAGNPYFIDFEILEKEGFLKKSDYEDLQWSETQRYVDYGLVYVNRGKVFKIIYENFKKNIPVDFNSFCIENEKWLNDYALFMAVKDAHQGAAFSTWEDDIRLRKPKALEKWSESEKEKIEYYKMLQYFFFKQWRELKEYANKKGINIIGDIPIYVSADSADLWTNPKQFYVDKDIKPIDVAGCPPDAFTADGQLWGNPVYNWEYHKKTKYEWWKNRIGHCFKIYDVIRIDHFRGFDEFYCIPFGSENAKKGEWRKGPGLDLFKALKNEFGELPIIAEDLGFLTDSVRKLLRDVGYPGMKVLQFAFNPEEESDYIPHTYIKNTIVYTGTHDNDTILGWNKSATPTEVEYAKEYLRAKDAEELRQNMMIQALSCVSNTCVLCMQDLIGLDSSARMNSPSTVGLNWKWRALEEEITEKQFEFIKYYSKLYGRNKDNLEIKKKN